MKDNGIIQLGMLIAARLPDIMPDEAGGHIKPVYEDIQSALRVPFVNLIFRVLANYPDYLLPAWRSLAPIVRTLEFERAADRLRARAALSHLPSKLEQGTEVPQLRAFNDTIHYVLPKLLLVATLLDERLSDPEDSHRESSGMIPAGIAEGATKVEMVDPDQASGRIKELFDSIKSTHGHPLVSSYFRGLAQWPEVLDALWSGLEPCVGAKAYEDRKAELTAQAGLEAKDLISLATSSPPEADPAELAALLAAFRGKFIPERLIDAVLVKAMLDGPEQATHSPFSVA